MEHFAVVGGETTIAVDTFDWDGSTGGAQTNIGATGTLVINSEVIDFFGSGFQGEVQVLGGRLVVNTLDPWRLEGTMTVTGGRDWRDNKW